MSAKAAAYQPDARLDELLIDLPVPLPEHGPVHRLHEHDGLCVISGALPHSEGRFQPKGRVGLEVPLDQGQRAARTALLHAVALLRQHYSTLNRVKECLRLTGYIATGPEFADHDKVFDPASQLLADLFRPHGRHARLAVGVASLPHRVCVMLELVVRIA